MRQQLRTIAEVVLVVLVAVAVTVAVAVDRHRTAQRSHTRITPAETRAISEGQAAQQQAWQGVLNDLSSMGRPVPDYGNAPGCTPNGCVAP